jgi:transcriptional regulator with XRE-family HTH domain
MASELQIVFGQRVRAERERVGLTQAELAKKLDIHQSDLCDIEKGRHSPKLETVEKIAKALEIPAVALLSQDTVAT